MTRTLLSMLFLVAGAVAAAAQGVPPGPPVVVVRGEGEVRTPPDVAFITLATEHREIESRLRALAVQMESYRDLPMAEHDMTVLNSRDASNALERLMAQETALAALLQEWVEQYQAMLKASTRVP